MSYELFYGLELIKQNGRLIPVVLHGSNNAYGYSRGGRQKRERSYSHLNAFRSSADMDNKPPFSYLFTKSGAFSYASVAELAADINTPRLIQEKRAGNCRFYIPTTAGGIIRHFEKRLSEYAALFPDRKESEEEKKRLEAEPPPHIWEAGSIESAVSSLYYCKAINEDDRERLFREWVASPLNPHLIIESEEQERALYWQYLLSEGIKSEDAELLMKERYWCGRFAGFHISPINWKLRREVV